MKTQNNRFCICNRKIALTSLNSIILKKLPITEIFFNKYKKSKSYELDQKIVFCNDCEHMSLTRIINPKIIYNKSYLTSSTSSFSARHANDIFYKFINKNLVFSKKYKKIIEIGSNDLYLLKKFSKKAKSLVGIDPVIKKNKDFKNLKTIKSFFTDLDNKQIGYNNSIIICGHTLEHVDNPEFFIKKTLSLADTETHLFFQFPSAESIINNCSFDQIHHQHLNYFSLKSFKKLLDRCGGKIINYEYNELHYGALMVHFTLNSSKYKKKKLLLKSRLIKQEFKKSYKIFKEHINCYKKLLIKYLSKKKKFYVVGAGLMLPLVNYHLDKLIDKADAILDDDPKKINKYFANINTKIISLQKTSLKKSVCLIASIHSAIITRKLVTIVKEKQAEIILVPTLTF